MRVLFVSKSIHDVSGAGVGSRMHLNVLKKLVGKENVYVVDVGVSETARKEEKYIAYGKYHNKLDRLHRCLEGNTYLFSNKIINDICQLIKSEGISFVFVDDSYFGNLVKTVKKECDAVTVVTFFHDIKASLFRIWMKTEPWYGKIDLRIGIAQEKISTTYTDANIVLNQNENRLLRNYYNVNTDYYFPVCVSKENIKQIAENPFCGNAGLHVISPKVLELVDIDADSIGKIGANGKPVKVDLDRQLLKPLAGTGKMFCYDSPEYVKDMGTPERYYSVCADYKEGRVSGKNLKNKQKAVFLDRDGTINKYVGFLRNIDDFELIDGVAEAVRKINESGYLAVVVTNQPVIARGEVSFEELEEIHNKMETLLGKEGAYLDAIYYCPHHPHKGYEGERPELKIDCTCRKPKPGMLLKAAEDFNIDLSQSWMVGDGENDIKAGYNAGCRTALIGRESYGQTVTIPTLKEFVEQCLK